MLSSLDCIHIKVFFSTFKFTYLQNERYDIFHQNLNQQLCTWRKLLRINFQLFETSSWIMRAQISKSNDDDDFIRNSISIPSSNTNWISPFNISISSSTVAEIISRTKSLVQFLASEQGHYEPIWLKNANLPLFIENKILQYNRVDCSHQGNFSSVPDFWFYRPQNEKKLICFSHGIRIEPSTKLPATFLAKNI